MLFSLVTEEKESFYKRDFPDDDAGFCIGSQFKPCLLLIPLEGCPTKPLRGCNHGSARLEVFAFVALCARQLLQQDGASADRYSITGPGSRR